MPEGWAVEEQKADSIALRTENSATSVFLSVERNNGLPTERFAQLYSKLLDNPTAVYRNKEYEDTYITYGTVNEEEAIMIVAVDGKTDKIAIILLAGNLDEPSIDTILDSIIEK